MEFAGLQGWKIHHEHDSRRQVRGRLVGDASAAGWPDLVLVRRGRMLILELKRDRGARISPKQAEWLEALAQVETASMGAVQVAVCHPRDWSHVEALLVGDGWQA